MRLRSGLRYVRVRLQVARVGLVVHHLVGRLLLRVRDLMLLGERLRLNMSLLSRRVNARSRRVHDVRRLLTHEALGSTGSLVLRDHNVTGPLGGGVLVEARRRRGGRQTDVVVGSRPHEERLEEFDSRAL